MYQFLGMLVFPVVSSCSVKLSPASKRFCLTRGALDTSKCARRYIERPDRKTKSRCQREMWSGSPSPWCRRSPACPATSPSWFRSLLRSYTAEFSAKALWPDRECHHPHCCYSSERLLLQPLNFPSYL